MLGYGRLGLLGFIWIKEMIKYILIFGVLYVQGLFRLIWQTFEEWIRVKDEQNIYKCRYYICFVQRGF